MLLILVNRRTVVLPKRVRGVSDKAKVLEKAVEIKGYSSKMISAWDVAHIPSADVVEVVRCKDCKWYEKGKSYTPYCNNVKNLFEEMV